MTDQTGPAGHDQLSVTAADESLQVGQSWVGGVLGEFAPLGLTRSKIDKFFRINQIYSISFI